MLRWRNWRHEYEGVQDRTLAQMKYDANLHVMFVLQEVLLYFSSSGKGIQRALSDSTVDEGPGPFGFGCLVFSSSASFFCGGEV